MKQQACVYEIKDARLLYKTILRFSKISNSTLLNDVTDYKPQAVFFLKNRYFCNKNKYQMNIYDISQEVFNGRIFPGDTIPSYTKISRMETGADYNLSDFQMCVHNATHIDAPAHFLREGKTVEQIELSRCIGPASVIELEGIITADSIRKNVRKNEKRILFKGAGILTPEAATELNKLGIVLVGTESQTVGDEENFAEIHLELLKKEVVILEGLVLEDVPAGNYFLFAAPLKLGGVEGAPCRAILTENHFI